MANGLFDKFRENALKAGAPNLDTATLKAALVDHGVTNPSLTTHDFYDDISGAVIASSGALANTTVTAGVFDADDITINAVSGASVESIVLYEDSGTPSTSDLILKLDTGVTGLPFTPSGSNVTIAWDSGANKIFNWT